MPTTAAHGERARYGAGCRCWQCTLANTRYQRLYRQRTTPAREVEVTTAGGLTYRQGRLPV